MKFYLFRAVQSPNQIFESVLADSATSTCRLIKSQCFMLQEDIYLLQLMIKAVRSDKTLQNELLLLIV